MRRPGSQAGGVPRACPDRLHLRGPVFPAGFAAGGPPRAGPGAGGQQGVGPAGPGGPAPGGERQAVQLRRRGLPRPAAGPCAQDLPAQLRRILRETPLCPRRQAGAHRDRLRAAGAVRHPAAVPVPADAGIRPGGGAVRGPVECPAPLHLPRPGGGHRHRQPFGQRRDGGQGGVPPRPGGQPVGPAALRLPVRFGRPRREHPGHGLCGPRPGGRERRHPGRDPAFPGRRRRQRAGLRPDAGRAGP